MVSVVEIYVFKIDLLKWVIVLEDLSFSDVMLFCGLDVYDVSMNMIFCYYSGMLMNVMIVFNMMIGYLKLVMGKIGNVFEFKIGVGVFGLVIFLL